MIKISGPHLTEGNRIDIEVGLKQNKSFKEISDVVDKSIDTIRNEIKNHREIKYPSSFNGQTNTCKHFKNNTCEVKHLCKSKKCNHECKLCKSYFCNKICSKYEQYECERLTKKPYCCNGCEKYKGCREIKMVYSASRAQQEYQNNLSNSRKGEHISIDEIDYINEYVAPRIKNGQSLDNIKMTDSNIKYSVPTLYNYTNSGLFSFGNLDLPKKVKYAKRNNKKDDLSEERITKITKLKENRNYKSFLKYSEEHPDYNIAEMDTVIGKATDSKVLLTLLFRKSNFMIALLVDNKKAITINRKLNKLKEKITPEKFLKLFRILLTDNGVEFTMIEEIEELENGEQINLFFCDAGKSNQKGKIEKNHVEIRKIIPKGVSFERLTNKDIQLMMSHINSYKRRKLGGLSPYEVMVNEYGKKFMDELMKSLGYKLIDPQDIILKPKLLKK